MRADRNAHRNGTHVRLKALSAGLRAVQRLNYADVPISFVTDDSRDVGAGSLFVAVKGVNVDGHRFIEEALARGASAIVCESVPVPLPQCPVIVVPDSRRALSALADAYYGMPSRELRVVGVTGTDGKSSTTAILASILERAGGRVGTLGTIQYRLGSRTLESVLTTPDALPLQRMLREMVQSGLSHVCMEVSSHALVHHRTAHVRFEGAVLTNVTEDHLDLHGSIENYVRAKLRLFEQLPRHGFAVINTDSPFSKRFFDCARLRGVRVLTYGIRSAADVTGSILSMDLCGMRIAVRTPLESYEVRTRLTGSYNCENVLAAAAAAFACDCGADAVSAAVRDFEGVPGRLEQIEVPSRPDLPSVCVDYAHTPNALRKVLTALRPLVNGRLICVFGCGGDRERQKRPLMARAATGLADLTIITSDNSRSERTDDIIADIVSGISPSGAPYLIEPDRAKAIRLAISRARGPGAMVAICGRGNERHQIVGNRKIPFDDRVVARQILEEMPQSRRKSA